MRLLESGVLPNFELGVAVGLGVHMHWQRHFAQNWYLFRDRTCLRRVLRYRDHPGPNKAHYRWQHRTDTLVTRMRGLEHRIGFEHLGARADQVLAAIEGPDQQRLADNVNSPHGRPQKCRVQRIHAEPERYQNPPAFGPWHQSHLSVAIVVSQREIPVIEIPDYLRTERISGRRC